MMPKIETKEEYDRAINEHAELCKDGAYHLSYAKIVRLGVLNDAIAEYEENQKQMPDLSFIIERPSASQSGYEWFKKLSKEQRIIYNNSLVHHPKLLKFVVQLSESDPEAAQLLKDIANVNK